jgi:hypothetical protein
LIGLRGQATKELGAEWASREFRILRGEFFRDSRRDRSGRPSRIGSEPRGGDIGNEAGHRTEWTGEKRTRLGIRASSGFQLGNSYEATFGSDLEHIHAGLGFCSSETKSN